MFVCVHGKMYPRGLGLGAFKIPHNNIVTPNKPLGRSDETLRGGTRLRLRMKEIFPLLRGPPFLSQTDDTPSLYLYILQATLPLMQPALSL